MNYTTLKADVANYLHRSDLTTPIIDFIEHARVRIGRDLRGIANQTAGTVTSFSNNRASLPANLSSLIGVWLDGVELTWMPVMQVENRSGGVYSVDGGDLIVPGAGSSTSVDISYWAIPAALVNGTDVSEGMAELPDLWRFAAVREGAIYVQDWVLADQMGALYAQVLLDANRQGMEARFGSAPAAISDYPSIQSMSRL